MTDCLVNGVAAGSITVEDRGFAYGDGLFETIAWRDGHPRFLDLHWARLIAGSRLLGLPDPPTDRLEDEIAALAGGTPAGTVKVIWTRGVGPRGYSPPPLPVPTRVVTFAAIAPTRADPSPFSLQTLSARAATHAALAGTKSLNRLDNVLARAELARTTADEGIMLDAQGRLSGGTTSNLFLILEGALVTPDLAAAGIRGVMRTVVLEEARRLGGAVREASLGIDALARAETAFVTNALIGLRAADTLDGRAIAGAEHPQVRAIMAALRRRGVAECRES